VDADAARFEQHRGEVVDPVEEVGDLRLDDELERFARAADAGQCTAGGAITAGNVRLPVPHVDPAAGSAVSCCSALAARIRRS
jgi:hypothetical protein